jgi:penicillin-binding protein 1A
VKRFDFAKLEEMESASVIYDHDNNVLGRIFLENRDAVSFDQFPPELIQSVIAAEDNRYFQHHGVDFYGMARAAIKNYRAGRIRQGASTLTQQLARNTFSLRERTYERKMIEIFLAQEIESRFSKQKILELYLNRVYFGQGFYGAEAAARGYFGKTAKELTLSECATLAGMLKNPNNLSPWSNRQACIETRNFVLGRMLDLKMITPEQYKSEIALTIAVKNRRPVHADSYAFDMVRQQVNELVGKDRAIADGYRIYTTIDADLQKRAEESLRAKLREIENREGYEHQTLAQYTAASKQRKQAAESGDDKEAGTTPEYLQGSLVVLDNSDGAILTLIGGRDFSQSQYNRAISAARPAGTAFKPLVYAAAFEKGMFPGTLVQDTLIDNRQVMIGGVTGILGEWGPEKADNKYEGAIPARYALVKSKNAATVRLGMQTGIDNVIALGKKAGVTRVVGKDEKNRELLNLRRFPATFLGSSEVTLMDMTLAYTMFPNLGWRPTEPYIIKRIEDKDGRLIFASKPQRQSVIKETTAFEVHSCLSDVLERGTGDKAFSEYGLKKFPVAGKTGTAYNFTDDWFIGYDSSVTCGVWAGFDKPSPIYRGAFSNEVTLPIWVEVMNATFAKYPPKETPQPRGLKKYEICLSSGQLATDKCFEMITDKTTGESNEHRTTYFEIATEEQAPRQNCTVHGEGGKLVAAATMPISNVPTQSQYPRATLAVDLAKVTAVPMKGPTVIGDEDPYNAVKPTIVLPALRASDGAPPPATSGSASSSAAPAATPEQTEVRRAEPVRALDQPAEDATIKVEPPPPLQF